ncbi:MAG: TonB family protein [Terriglobales bacterium]
MVVPQSKPFRSGKILGTDSDPLLANPGARRGDPPSLAGNTNESTALSSLKELIAAGDQRLDPTLATITDAARQMTGASGAALAMWKEGAMVCRARSGETAPALGARLSSETGISGECFRTGKVQNCVDTENDPLVDVEVCRSLGLRSIAVLPIQGWRGINGILEVFSTKPTAFTEQHITLLQQLAALAERARATQPHGASSAATKIPSEKPQPSGLLPASDRVGDVALAFLGTRSRPFALGAIGLLAISLIALMIWLGWRGPDEPDGKAHAASSAPVATSESMKSVESSIARMAIVLPPDKQIPDKHLPGMHVPDNDPVWKANPGGEALSPSGKPSAGSPVKFASKVDVLAGKKTPADGSRADRSQVSRSQENREPLLADVAANVALPHDASSSPTGLHSDSESDKTVAPEPSPASAASTNQFPASEVLSAKASLPQPSVLVSQGVTGGQLMHRVAPVYPAQARTLRLEGTVVLTAVVMEDGTVSDVRVVDGSPALARSAVDAVKQWRYKPYQLDGKPVKNEITINVAFKFSSDTASR